jgi:hypothetical protein
MSSLTLSDELRRELVRRRLPRFYVHRAVREFTDHCHDIDAEGTLAARADERIGDPRQLAKQFAAEFRKQHFAGRHPWLVFALAPLPCTILASALFYTLGFFVLQAIGSTAPTAATSFTSQLLAFTLCRGGLIVPVLAVTWWFGRWAYRSGCGARWFWTVATIQCLFAAVIQTDMQLPTEPGNGAFMVHVSAPPMNWPLLAMPLLASIGMAWHIKDRAKRLEVATS